MQSNIHFLKKAHKPRDFLAYAPVIRKLKIAFISLNVTFLLKDLQRLNM